ncbi:uncharacterized protein BJ171DRAFT_586836 [Polychytrium aggregatum]|uniref:uncharacterized protein n=1 Tax=Polychytrium aggregatum TaxID=110093 RepID=UPI0022FE5A43|nr:uncharacterized protein BJ171DRAFT_586836 [Polychytrium aggregatum]KAI9193558.1 hypothetical protein BJ171DRAFT_586836 [Polychytrium aggregatum]
MSRPYSHRRHSATAHDEDEQRLSASGRKSVSFGLGHSKIIQFNIEDIITRILIRPSPKSRNSEVSVPPHGRESSGSGSSPQHTPVTPTASTTTGSTVSTTANAPSNAVATNSISNPISVNPIAINSIGGAAATTSSPVSSPVPMISVPSRSASSSPSPIMTTRVSVCLASPEYEVTTIKSPLVPSRSNSGANFPPAAAAPKLNTTAESPTTPDDLGLYVHYMLAFHNLPGPHCNRGSNSSTLADSDNFGIVLDEVYITSANVIHTSVRIPPIYKDKDFQVSFSLNHWRSSVKLPMKHLESICVQNAPSLQRSLSSSSDALGPESPSSPSMTHRLAKGSKPKIAETVHTCYYDFDFALESPLMQAVMEVAQAVVEKFHGVETAPAPPGKASDQKIADGPCGKPGESSGVSPASVNILSDVAELFRPSDGSYYASRALSSSGGSLAHQSHASSVPDMQKVDIKPDTILVLSAREHSPTTSFSGLSSSLRPKETGDSMGLLDMIKSKSDRSLSNGDGKLDRLDVPDLGYSMSSESPSTNLIFQQEAKPIRFTTVALFKAESVGDSLPVISTSWSFGLTVNLISAPSNTPNNTLLAISELAVSSPDISSLWMDSVQSLADSLKPSPQVSDFAPSATEALESPIVVTSATPSSSSKSSISSPTSASPATVSSSLHHGNYTYGKESDLDYTSYDIYGSMSKKKTPKYTADDYYEGHSSNEDFSYSDIVRSPDMSYSTRKRNTKLSKAFDYDTRYEANLEDISFSATSTSTSTAMPTAEITTSIPSTQSPLPTTRSRGYKSYRTL